MTFEKVRIEGHRCYYIYNEYPVKTCLPNALWLYQKSVIKNIVNKIRCKMCGSIQLQNSNWFTKKKQVNVNLTLISIK